jgi:hypothetical protein
MLRWFDVSWACQLSVFRYAAPLTMTSQPFACSCSMK